MSVIRTPAKNATRAGPSMSPREEETTMEIRDKDPGPLTEPEKEGFKVRRSIDEIEARANPITKGLPQSTTVEIQDQNC